MRFEHLLSAIQVVEAIINVNISAQYDFKQAECHDGVFKDATGDGMYGDVILDETASCLESVGVQSSDLIGGRPAAYSLGNSSGFLNALQEPDDFPGFAIEVWMTLGTDLNPDKPCRTDICEYVIVSIHNMTLSPEVEFCGETTNIQLTYDAYQIAFKVNMVYSSSYCIEFATYRTKLTRKNLAYPFQLVFTTADVIKGYRKYYGYVLWFVNGTYVDWDLSYTSLLQTGRRSLVDPWHEGYNIQFLDKVRHKTSRYFEERSTKLYKVRLFSERVALQNEYDTVAALFAEGIANSAPVSYNVTAEINEDGEVGDHYYDPGLYLQEFEFTELTNIYLDIYDSDNDPTTLNYDNETLPRPFISALPHKGHIIDPRSGEVVTSTPYEVLPERGVFPVRYRPLLNEYSSSPNTSDPYTTFSYYAEDGTTPGLRSVEDATVHVYVVPKNDPPRASNLTLNAFAATRENIFNLLQGASDVDGSDEVQGAEIDEVPQNGTLYQVILQC